MAGSIGVPPWSYTWGELAVMAEGRDEAEWGHTSHLLSVILAFGGVKKSPDELNPYVAERKRIKDPAKLEELAEIEAEANRTAWRAFCDTFKK